MKVKVVVVSLDTASDRRARFSATVPADSLDWEFFDAHRGLAPGLRYDEAEAIRRKGRPLKPGELGCYSSHYAIWQQLLESDDDAYIVLEDDVVPDWKFLAALAREPLVQRGIRYLRLYYKYPARYLVRERNFVRRSTSIIELLDLAFGTQGYVVTKPAAEVFVKTFRNVVRPVDDQLDRHWEHGVPNLSVFPFPLFEMMLESDIGDDRFAAQPPRTLARRMDMWRDRVSKRLAIARRRRDVGIAGR
ncbi:glycosyltransferase family 25 protein [Croceibacterium sp. LX-88]|jgi:glycosyl transferase family 25|uniref:Glycosyltransferase family 25 protein n=1 Tax=Croceibacterium selenioxidans TaxID=2838833 RepID=A0ABS5VZ79_9SPHN|nr:glycosyltransferase family 25 protein [Croceibacterium selenioxidans]MBT2132816.1 glycosyltransferase family 25 protein [Croceibacterium selenioxidans]